MTANRGERDAREIRYCAKIREVLHSVCRDRKTPLRCLEKQKLQKITMILITYTVLRKSVQVVVSLSTVLRQTLTVLFTSMMMSS